MFNVLCIDDEIGILKLLNRLLTQASYKVITTTDPFLGLEILQKNPIDMIITDYKMPDMNGISFLKKAKQIAPDAIRVMITGYSYIDVTIAAINEGEIHKYITKPWDNTELLTIIDTAFVRKKIPHKKCTITSQELDREIKNIRKVLNSMSFSTIRALSKAIELKDKYTQGHCERVMSYARRLGKKAGLKSKQIEHLKYAATLHDIGKIGVPSYILNKPVSLTMDEWKIIKRHPTDGAQITSEIDFLTIPSRIILEHHERINGKGYPNKKPGNELLIESKILSIADVYDALISDRAYRIAMTMEKAKAILEAEKGKIFDHDLINIFLGEVI